MPTSEVVQGASSARAALEDAWSALDLAVSTLRGTEGDTVVASARVIGLLHLVAAAQREMGNALSPPALSARGFLT